MARNEQLIRQHKILQILERTRFGKTLEEIRDDLIEELGLSSLHVRTVRRDLEALQAAGIDVDSHDSPRGRVWKFGPQAKEATPITASATELIALSLSRDLLYPLAGTPFWQGIESFWNKIKDALPEGVWNHYEKYRRVLYVRGMPAKSYENHHGILSTINRAILEHRVVEVEYHKPEGKTPQTRKIEPYAVVFYQSSLYIVAAAAEAPEGEGRIRHFKLDRFKKATSLDAWFKPPRDFDPQEHLERTLGIFTGEEPQEFHIRIAPRAARWVMEDPWREDQEIEPQGDGGIILKVRAGHELDVIPRVLALGDQAEVLHPESCRQAIAEIVEKLSSVYGAAASRP
jgi:predicted DNA-binding transcriptional regulator YafY